MNKKTVRIYVTPADIRRNRGIIGPTRCTTCPVAQAITRRLIPGFEAVVNGDEYRIQGFAYPGGDSGHTMLPMPVRDAIRQLDDNVLVPRFNFRIELPAKVLR